MDDEGANPLMKIIKPVRKMYAAHFGTV